MSDDIHRHLSGTDRVEIPVVFDRPAAATPVDGVAAAPRLASTGQRVGAYLVEAAIWSALSLVPYVVLLGGAVPLGGFSLILALIAWLGLGVLQVLNLRALAIRGATIGKQIVGIRVVDETTHAPVGWGRAFLRMLLQGAIIGFTCGLGGIVLMVVASSNPRRQGWHDAACHTVVLVGAMPRSPAESSAAVAMPPAPRPMVVRLDAPTALTPIVGPPPGMVGTSRVSYPPNVVAARPPVVVPPTGSAPPRPHVPQATIQPPPKRVPPPAPPSAAQAPVAWTVTVEGGPSRVVEGTVVVGRDPVDSAHPAAELWAVDDPGRSMSKTHAAFGVTDGELWVEDRHSTNGVVVQSGGVDVEPAALERHALRAGDRVLLGDRVFDVRRGD